MKISAKYKFGSATRLPPMKGTDVPGPGNYMSSLVDKRAAPKFGFGTQKRDGSPGMSSTFPGPGEYKLGGFMGRDGPSVSMHNKLKNLGSDVTPGPGTYESHLKNKRDAPKYGVGTEQRSNSQAKMATPAPNAYNPSSGFV